MQNTTDRTAHYVAHLNDLLQLDYDAVAAYKLTLHELASDRLRADLQAHLADHERHIEELGRHIDELGGMKMPMPHASGVFKLATQAAVAAASDRAVLLAFKANEIQARDKYARMSEHDFPPHIADTIRRAAADERRHYEWAVRELEAMGADRADADVRATKAFAHVHGRTADAIETAERGAMYATEKARNMLRSDPVKVVVTTGLAVLGAGVVLRHLARRR